MTATTDDYNAAIHITAGEIRAMGVHLPETIPDVAWVPRSSLQFTPDRAELGDAEGEVRMNVYLRFTVPFRWIATTIVLDGDTPQEAVDAIVRDLERA